jgi:hypothetical protein
MNIPKSKTKWQKTQPEIMFKKIKILAKIKLFVNNYIKDILVINIKEDKLFLKEHELKKLPKFIQNMLRFSENR